MVKAAGVAFLLASYGAIATAFAEDAPYAEYRYQRNLAQIQVTTGFMERTSDLTSRLAALERDGIVVLETDKARMFTRTERVGALHIETVIVIKTPVGHGEGGASSNVDLRMVVDGKTRVDCPLRVGGRGLDRVVLEPARGFVMVNGYDGVLRFDGFASRGIVDDEWLAGRADVIRTLLADSPRHSLIGSWRLVSYEDHPDGGAAVFPFGTNPRGLLVYTSTGEMSIQVMKQPHPKAASGDDDNVTPEAKQALYDAFMSYFGTFAVDRNRHVVTHHVIGDLWGVFDGRDEERQFELAGDRLTLTPEWTSAGKHWRGSRVFERIK